MRSPPPKQNLISSLSSRESGNPRTLTNQLLKFISESEDKKRISSKQFSYLSNKAMDKDLNTNIDVSGYDLTEINFQISRELEDGVKPISYNSSRYIKATFGNKANLSNLSFIYANFSYAKLGGADLTGAKLIRTDLTKADLTGADLSWVDLTKEDLTGANLTGANLNGTNFSEAKLNGAKVANVIQASINEETIPIPPQFYKFLNALDKAQRKEILGTGNTSASNYLQDLLNTLIAGSYSQQHKKEINELLNVVKKFEEEFKGANPSTDPRNPHPSKLEQIFGGRGCNIS